MSIGTHSVIRATCYLLALSVSPSASLAQQLDLDALYAQAAADGDVWCAEGSMNIASAIAFDTAEREYNDAWNAPSSTRVNRRWIGTPYRHPKGTPLSGGFWRAGT